MKRSLLIVLLLIGGLLAQAQSTYFVYVQAEPAQPFLITYKNQTFRSSSSGYSIISNLTDSLLQFVLRFPNQNYPDQSFSVTTQRSDQGYLLKDYGDKGWGLLDWNTLVVSYADRPTASKNNRASAAGQSDFATLLARASGDSTLLLDSSTPARITNSKPAAAEVKTIDEVKPVVKEEKPVQPKQVAPTPVPAYCKSILTEAEFNECLSKVQIARSETSKVNVLRDFSKGRCYTIEQVRAFARLLTTDEVRYDFLLEAWTLTVERTRYLELASVFENAATADRFKEMFQ